MIVKGPCVGPPREIDFVSHIGDKLIIETHPAQWGLVSEVKPLRVRIPIGRAAGSNGVVSWGETRLAEDLPGVRLLDVPPAGEAFMDPSSSPSTGSASTSRDSPFAAPAIAHSAPV
jgi:hypothetical protein